LIITIFGKSESKKNKTRYNPVTKRRYNDPSVKAAEDYFMLQIPREHWGLKLEHPNVTYRMTVPHNSTRQDRDNLLTFVQDLLVKIKLFRSDNIKWHNGHIHIPPATLGEDNEYMTVVEINE
jgi:Holliday junction resolvase RusA-like endonuclease